MPTSLQDMNFIDASCINRLSLAGIRTSTGLLFAGNNRQGRRELARLVAISEEVLLDWVHRCDLMRIKGITAQDLALLHASGVSTLERLGEMEAISLAAQLNFINEECRCCAVSPGVYILERWIEQARELVPVVTHR